MISILWYIVMAAELTEGLTGRGDWKALAAFHLAATRAGLNATLHNPLVDDPRVHHVRYPDFVADPVGTIRGVYQHAGEAFTPACEAAMRYYLRNNRSDRYGKFRYSTDVIGEDVAALHAEFAPYRERFGLTIEQRD